MRTWRPLSRSIARIAAVASNPLFSGICEAKELAALVENDAADALQPHFSVHELCRRRLVPHAGQVHLDRLAPGDHVEEQVPFLPDPRAMDDAGDLDPLAVLEAVHGALDVERMGAGLGAASEAAHRGAFNDRSEVAGGDTGDLDLFAHTGMSADDSGSRIGAEDGRKGAADGHIPEPLSLGPDPLSHALSTEP